MRSVNGLNMVYLAQYRLLYLPILLAISGLLIFSACGEERGEQAANDSSSSSDTSTAVLPTDLYFVELSVALKWQQDLFIRAENAAFSLMAAALDGETARNHIMEFYKVLGTISSDLLGDLEAIAPPVIAASEHDELQEVFSERIGLYSRIASSIERNESSEEARAESQDLIAAEEQLNSKYHDACMALHDIAISESIPIELPCTIDLNSG